MIKRRTQRCTPTRGMVRWAGEAIILTHRPCRLIRSADTDWNALYVRHLIPKTGVELIANETYILEAGFERLNGVDFQKGCYVGQEVTRTDEAQNYTCVRVWHGCGWTVRLLSARILWRAVSLSAKCCPKPMATP